MRRAMGALLGGLALSLVLTGCGSDDGERPGPVGGQFVGPAATQRDFVAVLAEPAAAAGERRVRAYLCGGNRAEWFRGTVVGNSVTLTSLDGDARLQAQLSPGSATGTVLLPDGTPVGFSLPPAREGAGVYDLSFRADGSFSGASTVGDQVTGRISPEGQVSGTVTTAAGASFSFQFLVRPPVEAGEYTTIALPRFQNLRGSKSSIKTTGTATGYIDPTSDI